MFWSEIECPAISVRFEVMDWAVTTLRTRIHVHVASSSYNRKHVIIEILGRSCWELHTHMQYFYVACTSCFGPNQNNTKFSSVIIATRQRVRDTVVLSPQPVYIFSYSSPWQHRSGGRQQRRILRARFMPTPCNKRDRTISRKRETSLVVLSESLLWVCWPGVMGKFVTQPERGSISKGHK
jgi:hypothetical protein